jgi:16S rRNA pseudouridine516 synthase
MTDDGALLHKIISPKRHIAKRYRAKLARPLDPAAEPLFAAGTLMLEGEDKPLLPAQLEIIDPLTAYLTIFEGRYHQVRRMFAAVGNHVAALHRDKIGELALPNDLSPGALCVLTEARIEAIFKPGD